MLDGLGISEEGIQSCVFSVEVGDIGAKACLDVLNRRGWLSSTVREVSSL